jgi:hypothetical protein
MRCESLEANECHPAFSIDYGCHISFKDALIYGPFLASFRNSSS